MALNQQDILDGGFKQGLFGCFANPNQCALTCLLPFYAMGKQLKIFVWFF